MKANVWTVLNLKYYTPKTWERVMLLFLRTQIHESEDGVIVYKQIGRRMYIIVAQRKPMFDSGYSQPGVN